MNAETVEALEEINRRFYHRHAASFSVSRAAPWPGWNRLLPHLQATLADPDARILDLGCGNGRFLRWLGTSPLAGVTAVAADRSLPLLARAADCGAYRVAADPLSREDRGCFRDAGFDVVTLMGVLHHVPSRVRRQALLQRIHELLRPGGLSVVTCWRFADRPRFRRRTEPWQEYNRRSERPIDIEQLEPGDALLRWGSDVDPAAIRYCHHTDSEEVAELFARAGFQILDRFRADGMSDDLNDYLVAAANREPRAPAGRRRT